MGVRKFAPAETVGISDQRGIVQINLLELYNAVLLHLAGYTDVAN